MRSLPVIDMAPLLAGTDPAAQRAVARAIDAACRAHGFFYVTGHGIPAAAFDAVDSAARATFALPEAEKATIAMAHGGRAWRGWFPLHGELTSGRPDGKEGLYFGEELGPEDPRVAAGWPHHGGNLWPSGVPALRLAVLGYMDAATRAAHALAGGVALALGLPFDYFASRYTARPTLLFRIFRYPPDAGDGGFGVGEHTDYGFLTLLAQDSNGGLEVKTPAGWIEAPALPGTLVVNIGDMLDRLTGGVYRSTPHRVVNRSGRERLSWPLFFDPASTHRSNRCPASPSMRRAWRSTAATAGTAVAYMRRSARTATICSARSARSFLTWQRRRSEHRAQGRSANGGDLQKRKLGVFIGVCFASI